MVVDSFCIGFGVAQAAMSFGLSQAELETYSVTASKLNVRIRLLV